MSTDPKKQSARAKGRTVSLRISSELAAHVERAELRLRITAAEILQVSLGKLLQELERSGQVVLPLNRGDQSTAPPVPVLRLPDPLTREVLAAAETVGVLPLDLVREGVHRLVDELRAEGSIRFNRRSVPGVAGDRMPASGVPKDEGAAVPSEEACDTAPKLAS